MRLRYTICAGALVAAMAFGCGKDDEGSASGSGAAGVSTAMSEDELMQQTVAAMREMTATLKTVKDEASAKAAEPKLKALNARMEAIEKAVQSKGQMTPEREQAMQEKYKSEFESAMGDFMKEGMRIATDPKLSAWMDTVMPGGPSVPAPVAAPTTP